MSQAQIHTRGYRRYEGERTGIAGAVRTVVFDSWRRALGIKRSLWNKIVPVLMVFLAYVPGMAFVGVASILPDELRDVGQELVADYASYYGFIIAAIFLFSAFVSPELLCTDRRSGLLGLYLASPLTRVTYLEGKAIAVLTILGLVTLFPPFLLLVGYSLVGYGPANFTDFMELVVKIVAAGLVVSLLYTMIGLAISASTDRKVVATASIIGVLFGSQVVVNILLDFGDFPRWVASLNLLSLPMNLVYRIHGQSGEAPNPDLSTSLLVGVYLAVVAVCGVWIWNRYRNLVVNR